MEFLDGRTAHQAQPEVRGRRYRHQAPKDNYAADCHAEDKQWTRVVIRKSRIGLSFMVVGPRQFPPGAVRQCVTGPSPRYRIELAATALIGCDNFYSRTAPGPPNAAGKSGVSARPDLACRSASPAAK